MTDALHWIGVALGFILIGFAVVGVWRGLSLKPTDPATRAPDRMSWFVRRW